MSWKSRTARRELLGVQSPSVPDGAKPSDASASRAITVTELAMRITRQLEEGIGRVRVEAEVSNLRLPASGHAYFVLKDANASINAVCFRSTLARLRAQLRDGCKIDVTGRVTAWAPRSQYQIIVETAREAGVGDLMRNFIELRDKLKAQGLFDPERKQALPILPRRIGLVTSATGAAVRDMIDVLGRRGGGLDILIAPCAVQGAAAPREIVRALHLIERHGTVEVIIVGRGGGSIEDLWAFNDEQVVRAIALCGVPIVSAVGHETDTTLSDFVADLRAPTPSAAAELVTANHMQARENMVHLKRHLNRNIERRLRAGNERLNALASSWGLRRMPDRLQRAMQMLDDLTRRLHRSPQDWIVQQLTAMRGLQQRLDMQSPRRRTDMTRLNLEALCRRLSAAGPEHKIMAKVKLDHERIIQLNDRLLRWAGQTLHGQHLRCDGLAQRLEGLGHHAVLKRGYSYLTTLNERQVITSPDQVRTGQTLKVHSEGGKWRVATLSQEPELFDEIDEDPESTL